MSSYSEQLERLRAHIVNDDPWASGTIDLPEHFTKLYYSEKADPMSSHTLFLNKSATSDKLASLADTCEPASFGRGGEDVLDESYRKARKMDTISFSSPFNLHELRILERVIPTLLRGRDADKPVFAELYKLNVYGPGSFFRSHKDTPRSNKMFGSLVVVFPTAHKGGSLALRHNQKEFTFDSSRLVTEGTNKAAFVAFFSDVEHEVLPVTEGYRVTLAYNLYFSGPSGVTNPAPVSVDEILNLKNSISALLDNPTFLPDGGILGFGLNFSYPITRGGSRRSFDTIISHLKGSDELIKIACEELGLRVNLKGIVLRKYEDEDRRIMLSYPAEFSNQEIENLSLELVESWGGELIHTPDKDPDRLHHETFEGMDKTSKAVFWVTKSAEYSTFESKFISYGNEAELESFYADVCLMVTVGPTGDRTAPYDGVKIY